MLQKNVRGFAMITVIVAFGMTGGLAMVLAKLSTQQMTLQKRSESWVELEALTQRIGRILYNSTACFNTIQNDSSGNPIVFNSGITTVSLGHIKNNGGRNVISSNDVYGNGLIKISSLALEGITVADSVGRMNLQVTLEKIAKSITGYKKAVRTYPLIVNLNSTNLPIDCQSDLGAAIANVRKELCIETGGTYNGPGNTPVCTPPTVNKVCPASADPSEPPLLPTGFDSSGNLQCAAFPLVSGDPHPIGLNCFLLTLYKKTHGQSGELFQPIDTNAVAANNGDPTDVTRRERWKINDNCPAPPSSGVAEYTCDLTTTGGMTRSYAVKVCPFGYSNRFVNPVGTLNDSVSGTLAVSGAHAFYMQHYCCK